METRANFILVGSFVIALTAGIFLFLMWYAHHRDAQNYETYVIYFKESVAGLDEGGVVRYRGIQVGKVESIELDPNNPEQARVAVKIAEKTPVNSTTRATLNFQGVTGVAYVELKGSARDGDRTLVQDREMECPIIPSEPSQFETLSQTIPEVLERIKKLFSDDNIRSLSSTLGNVEQFTGALGGQASGVEELIASTTEAMKGFSKLAADLDKQAAAATGNINALTQNLNEVVKDNREQVRSFSDNTLAQLPPMVAEMRRLIAEAKALSKTLKENPSRVIFGKEPEGYKAP